MSGLMIGIRGGSCAAAQRWLRWHSEIGNSASVDSRQCWGRSSSDRRPGERRISIVIQHEHLQWLSYCGRRRVGRGRCMSPVASSALLFTRCRCNAKSLLC
eukprot:7400975-Pyramimonas_sp.AAC.1